MHANRYLHWLTPTMVISSCLLNVPRISLVNFLRTSGCCSSKKVRPIKGVGV